MRRLLARLLALALTAHAFAQTTPTERAAEILQEIEALQGRTNPTEKARQMASRDDTRRDMKKPAS